MVVQAVASKQATQARQRSCSDPGSTATQDPRPPLTNPRRRSRQRDLYLSLGIGGSGHAEVSGDVRRITDVSV